MVSLQTSNLLCKIMYTVPTCIRTSTKQTLKSYIQVLLQSTGCSQMMSTGTAVAFCQCLPSVRVIFPKKAADCTPKPSLVFILYLPTL